MSLDETPTSSGQATTKEMLESIIADPTGFYDEMARNGADIPRHRMASDALATLGVNRNRKATKRVQRAHTDGVDRNIAARHRLQDKLLAKREAAKNPALQ